MERDLDPGANYGCVGAMIRGARPMSKAERLHRWAAALELEMPLRRRGPGASRRRDGGNARASDRCPLAIAGEDWAFQAEGLRSARWRDARAFFDLSEGEMRHILGSPDHGSGLISAALAAERVRALAEQADAAAVPDRPAAGSLTGLLLRNGRWFGDRRATGIAAS